MELQPENIAPFLARLMLGMLFLAQGYDKVFNIGVARVVETITPAFTKMRLPPVLIRLSALFTSYAELAGGLLLIVGLLKYASLYVLGIDLLLVSMGFSLLNPVWDMNHVINRFVLLLFLLIYPAELDTIMLSGLFK